MEKGHHEPWVSCHAAQHPCEKAIEYRWRVSTSFQTMFLDPSLTCLTARESHFGHSADLEPANPELYEATVARLATFAFYWCERLTRPSYGKTNHSD